MVKKILGCLLIVTMVFPPHLFAASKKSEVQRDLIAIVPMSHDDPEISSINREISTALSRELSRDFKIINSKTIDQIVKTTSFQTIFRKENIKSLDEKIAIELIQKARRQFSLHRNFESAVSVIDEAIFYLRSKVEPKISSSHLLVTALLNKGWFFYKNDRFNEATEVIHEIYTIQGNIDAKGFPGNFKKFILSQKSAIKDASSGITVKSKPDAVDVSVNGLFIGSSPLEKNLPSGKYIVQFFANGRKSVKKNVIVRGNLYSKVFATLSWNSDRKKEKGPAAAVPLFVETEHTRNLAIANQVSSSTSAKKTVFIQMSPAGSGYLPQAFVFDSELNQPYVPVMLKKVSDLKSESHEVVTQFSQKLSHLVSKKANRSYRENFPEGTVLDQRVASRPKKPFHKQPAFWAGIGGVVLGGIILGLVLSKDSSSSASDTGSITVGFEGFR